MQTEETEMIEIDDSTTVQTHELGDTSEQAETVTTEETPETPDEPTAEAEEEFSDVDLDALELLDGTASDGGTIVQPLAFIEKLDDEGKKAYLEQIQNLSKPIVQIRELRKLAGEDDPEQVKSVVALGAEMRMFGRDIAAPETQAEAVERLFAYVENVAGRTIEEIIPDRFGLDEDDDERRRVAKIEAENRKYRQDQEQSKRVNALVSEKGEQIVSLFKKQSGGFALDINAVAPHLVNEKSLLESVRAAQPKAWEAHLIELGRRKGLKEAKASGSPDLVTGKATGTERGAIYESGPFAGQPKPKSA